MSLPELPEEARQALERPEGPLAAGVPSGGVVDFPGAPGSAGEAVGWPEGPHNAGVHTRGVGDSPWASGGLGVTLRGQQMGPRHGMTTRSQAARQSRVTDDPG